MTRKMSQSYTTDQPRAPRGRDTEHWQPHGNMNTMKLSSQLSLSQQDDCKTRKDTKYYTKKQRPLHPPPPKKKKKKKKKKIRTYYGSNETYKQH